MILTTDAPYSARYTDSDSWLTIVSEDAVFPVAKGQFIVAAQVEEPVGNVVILITPGNDAVIIGVFLSKQGSVNSALEFYSRLTGSDG